MGQTLDCSAAVRSQCVIQNIYYYTRWTLSTATSNQKIRKTLYFQHKIGKLAMLHLYVIAKTTLFSLIMNRDSAGEACT